MVNVELLMRWQHQRLERIEIPITHRPRRSGKATGAAPGVIAHAMAEFVRLWWRTIASPWFEPRWPALACAAGVFAVAIGIRTWLFQGFVLGDDPMEYGLIQHVLHQPVRFDVDPILRQLLMRFMVWVPNWLVQRCFGSSEWTFFLPTFVFSCTFPLMSFVALRRGGYSLAACTAAGLFTATAPFEVVLGTVRANDLILAWFMGISFLAWVWPGRRDFCAGMVCAAFLWLAFYVKLWAYYVLPALAIYVGVFRSQTGVLRRAAGFACASFILHGVMGLYWKAKTGYVFPFLVFLAPTYPVPPGWLWTTLLAYPRMLFQGSEFATTFFGWVPLLALVVPIAKKAAAGRNGNRGFDRLDCLLASWMGVFFLLLEFFPNHVRLDHYYSVPRIFRYLAPLSFPMTLWVAKGVLDTVRSERAGILGLCALALMQIAQAHEATRPGRLHRRAVSGVLEALERYHPPRLVLESWLSYFFATIYLPSHRLHTTLTSAYDRHQAVEFESWLANESTRWEAGTFFLTGLSNYTHYGCASCGPRVDQFVHPPALEWMPLEEVAPLPYNLNREPARLWIKVGQANPQ